MSIKLQITLLALLTFCLSNFANAKTDGIPDSLDRGHRILLQRGLQPQTLVFPYSYPTGESFSMSRWAESEYSTPNTHETAAPQTFGAAPGIPWSRWMWWDHCTGDKNLLEHELSYLDNLVSLQAQKLASHGACLTSNSSAEICYHCSRDTPYFVPRAEAGGTRAAESSCHSEAVPGFSPIWLPIV